MPQTGRPGSPNPTALYPAILGFASSWPRPPLLAAASQTRSGGVCPADFCVPPYSRKRGGRGAWVGVQDREALVLRWPGVGLTLVIWPSLLYPYSP